MEASEGFGVAGHVNSYSRGVLVCRRGDLVPRWNEDRFGEELVGAKGMRVDPFESTSETRSAYIRPVKMDDKQIRHFPKPVAGAYAQSRDGMAGRLLFAHGLDAHDPESGKSDHYASMSQTLHTLKGVRPHEVIKPARPGAQAQLVSHATRTSKLLEKKKADSSEATSSQFATTSRQTQRLRSAGSKIMGAAGSTTGVDLASSKGRRADFTRTFKSGVGLRR